MTHYVDWSDDKKHAMRLLLEMVNENEIETPFSELGRNLIKFTPEYCLQVYQYMVGHCDDMIAYLQNDGFKDNPDDHETIELSIENVRLIKAHCEATIPLIAFKIEEQQHD